MASNPNKALWEKGDFTRIASYMRESGAELAKSVGRAGEDVLDVGCGDGTTAVPLAQLGARRVTGVDISAPLVAAGNRRAAELGLSATLTFQEGDASAMTGIADGQYDLVITIFGAMFAPRPNDVAKELVRVAKKGGGRIVMGNWIPGDPTLVAQLLRISAAYTPPPPEGFVSPMTWGVEATVLERFVAAGVPKEAVSFSRETYTFVAPTSPASLVADFRAYYGPTMNAFAAAEKDGKANDLQRELEALFTAQNTAVDGTTRIAATYLKVTVHV